MEEVVQRATAGTIGRNEEVARKGVKLEEGLGHMLKPSHGARCCQLTGRGHVRILELLSTSFRVLSVDCLRGDPGALQECRCITVAAFATNTAVVLFDF